MSSLSASFSLYKYIFFNLSVISCGSPRKCLSKIRLSHFGTTPNQVSPHSRKTSLKTQLCSPKGHQLPKTIRRPSEINSFYVSTKGKNEWHSESLLLLLFVITCMQGIYNYIPETNHVTRVYIVAAVLSLQSVLPVMLFRMLVFCTLTLVLLQCVCSAQYGCYL